MKRTLLIAATLLTVLSMLNVWWWMYNAVDAESFEKAVSDYISVFPKTIQDGRLIGKLSLIPQSLSIAALIYLISKGYKMFITLTVFVLCSFMFVWTVFSLM